ncbi:MAG: bifunctional (p)ppGpp synthetase/guanosine-3',5'-bis(diphosphate) 3'-pyrophosphohydrolase [Candidatus Marinimicrobia bacterium]|nr:bifunctional (p)ppGpp synthetase/guanosine-3',5'-bis(diphosphate) 3'-pyrophosphohydrolase [Candidatus Neomarinimicrobiota bacterium]
MVTGFVKRVFSRRANRSEDYLKILDAREAGRPLSRSEESMIWSVYQFAKEAHEGQKRKSGQDFFAHPYQTALILAKMSMDAVTIAGGLLHDVVEDTEYTKEDVKGRFNQEVARLVEGVTKITDIEFHSREHKQAEYFRRMLLSVAKDIRVLLIKLADRLHNMRTLEHMPETTQRRIAIETRDVYAPLAHRLGMYKVKAELEDLVLKTLHPDDYKFLQRRINETREKREEKIENFSKPLKEALKKHNIPVRIKGRSKHFYSIYRKMKKRNKPFEEIYDLLAIRVITDTKENCYKVLGLVHELYNPISERFKDYIANHKANYYQSIHTTVYGPDGNVYEIQIRTEEMHEIAEEGVAAHWRYKEGVSKDQDIDKYVKWLRDLMDVLQPESAEPGDFMKTLKIDLFQDEIFVFTPKGDLIRLPKGATPIDFAFAVHTEVGYACIGAKVNGKMVPLNTKLKNGQTVEVITSGEHNPSYAWLQFVKTSKAIGAIKKWMRKKQLKESIKLGKKLLKKEDRKDRIENFSKQVKNQHQELGYKNSESLLAAIGKGEITVEEIYKKLYPQESQKVHRDSVEEHKKYIETARKKIKGVKVDGISNLMVKFAKCCNPVPGDPVIGYVSRGRGVIIHRTNCTNVPALIREDDRIKLVDWDIGEGQKFMAKFKIVAQDKKHLLSAITDVISGEDANIVDIEGKADDVISRFRIILEVINLEHLKRIIKELKKVQGVITVERK